MRINRILGLLLALCSAPLFAAGAKVHLMQSGANISDQASLQRGAGLYFSYCASCHSLQYMRYSRMAQDLGLTEAQVMESLAFPGAKFGDTIVNAMPAGAGDKLVGGEDWFGKAPPDLSLTARVRGKDWIYTYLMSFYPDPTRPAGWNNVVFPNASMPHVMWDRQGIQHANFVDMEKNEKGEDLPCKHGEVNGRCFESFELAKPGTRSAEEYAQDARDLEAFLQYVGEPAALLREKYGLWVILYLLLFTGFAYMLKAEYWRDVH